MSFPCGQKIEKLPLFKVKVEFGIILSFEVSKLSITGIIKIILKEKEIKVNYGIVIFRPTLMIMIL